jgi:copper chaperone CopZ
MKYLLMLVLFVVTTGGSVNARYIHLPPHWVTVELSIKGMTCQVCQEHITWKVNQLPGIAEVAVSYRKGNAIITFNDSKTSIDAIVTAIHAIDFEVTGRKIISRKPIN